ncbi:MAG: shikimate kinase [Alphaproteobacteria bacterium]
MEKIINSISLIGMPGAGKTSIGKELAKVANLPFFDADIEIEKSAGRSIPDIFKEFGEDHFRDGETKVIARLLDDKKCVLSTGGGAYTNAKTKKVIDGASVSVFIDVDIDTLWQRVKGKNTRPLFNVENPKQALEDIYKQRYSIYKKADIVIKYDNSCSSKKIAKVILTEIKQYEKKKK